MGRELRAEERAVDFAAIVRTFAPRKAAELYRLALERDSYLEYALQDRLTALAASGEA